MTSDLLGPDEALPEPPAPDGPGLFGDAPAAAPPAPREAEAAYRVLARKYRPRSFPDLIGQDALVRTLRNAFEQNRVAHAFLLTGVRGVGKTTTARIIARALNCVGPSGAGGPTADPCGVCPECRAILADRHPDVLELDAASNNSVDDVRELREAVRFRPAQGRFKVYILDEVHMLSGAAFNALLKTLEEPPPAVKFIFATTELRKVPATIRSRCQTFHLRRVPQLTLREHLSGLLGREHVSAEEEAVAMVARAADGSVRDGLSLLDQAIALAGPDGTIRAEAVRDMLGLADRGLSFDLLEAALAGRVADALRTLDTLLDRGADPGQVLSELLERVHLLTRLRAVPELRREPSLAEEERERGARLADSLALPVLARAWQMLLKGLQEIAEAPDRRAAAEMVLIRLAHLSDLPTPGDLVRRLQQGGSAPAPRPVPGGSQGGAQLRAIAGGGVVSDAAPEPAPAALAAPRSFRDIVALAAEREPLLHGHLLHSVHPVAFAEGRIELRVDPRAPRDLAAQLLRLLDEATGRRWAVVLSNAEGGPTLAEQGRAAVAQREAAAIEHPLVQAILSAFPGARLEAVRDGSTDRYGLAAEPDDDIPPPEGDPFGPDSFPEEDP
jgi:DNA polymerase III subunit gamma/tau